MRKLLVYLPLVVSTPAVAFDEQTMLKVFFNIVQVHAINIDNSGEGFGSGVVVAEHRVLTNCHVLHKAKSAWISQGEDSYPIDGVKIDAHHDLCLLVSDRLPLKAAEIGSVGNLKDGMDVFALGHSSGSPSPVMSDGQIKGLYPFEGSRIIRSSAPFAMGASGSGLFDDNGRLVGINTFKTFGKVAYFYAMPADWIAHLEALPTQPVAPSTGTAFWEDEKDRPFFLQAAIPELQENWTELLQLSERWVAADPDDAEAWYERGQAQEKLNMLEAAQQSYQKTISLDPAHGDALFHLGIFASRRGDQGEMHRISAALAQIDRVIAEDFNKAAGCTAAC
ncbi:periplasmic pH-dependent serine endoprotease DegQ precursor [mine drainage metagenome]|uniref:Periplasmic pH-dependent serine endoprotease DegQ n=1 Tax=mine drainage metagenome TaxID=410659 RepID=A0A1J5Q9X4_9ZZZZ